MLHFAHFYFNLKDELCNMRWWVMLLYPVSRTLLRCDWISSNWISKVYQSFSPSKRLWQDISNVHPHLSSHHFLVSGAGYNKHALIHVWIGWRPTLSTHLLLQREQQIALYLHVNNINCSHTNYKSAEHDQSLTEWSLLTALSEAFEWRKSFERIVVESIT